MRCWPSASDRCEVMLRGVVDQLLFGDRPDALTAASSLADQIGDDPVLALAAIREALVLPYASLRVADETLATSGSEVTHTRVLPLRLGRDLLGEVVVGLRPGDLSLSSADEDVLRIVAPLLAQTLRARALARDLKESRGAAITAIEDERRRLRRDIHDGLGPTLSGVAFSADAARNQIRSAPERAEELLAGTAGRHRRGDPGDPATGRRVAASCARRARPGRRRTSARGSAPHRRGSTAQGGRLHTRRAAHHLGGAWRSPPTASSLRH